MSHNKDIEAVLNLRTRLGASQAPETVSVEENLKSRVAAEKLARLALETNAIVADFMDEDVQTEEGDQVVVTISVSSNGRVYFN